MLSVLLLGCVTVKGVPEGHKFFRGLIHKPNPKKTPEEIQRLNKIYKSISLTSLPSYFDARDNGKHNKKSYVFISFNQSVRPTSSQMSTLNF